MPNTPTGNPDRWQPEWEQIGPADNEDDMEITILTEDDVDQEDDE